MPSFNTYNALQGPPGASGEDAYLYIAYADDSSGGGFSNTFDSSKNFIAFLNRNTPITTPIASDFTGLWKNIKGSTGATGAAGSPGAAGQDSFLYIGYADDSSGGGFTNTFAPEKDYIAFLRRTTALLTPVASDFTGLWKNIKGQQGEQGATGGGSLLFTLDGSQVGEQTTLDLIPGANINISAEDDPISNRVRYTINADPAEAGALNIQLNDVAVEASATLNIIQGSNTIITAEEDVPNNRINVTIGATASGGAGSALLNVRDYGAVGNYTSSDTAAIQAAINDCVAQGKSGIYIPDGTYRMTSGLVTPSARQHPQVIQYSASTNRIIFDRAHGLRDGQVFVLIGYVPYGMIPGKGYFVRVIDSTTVEPYDTRSNALNTASTTGIIDLADKLITGVNTGTNVLTIASGHELITGNVVRFQSSGTLPGGIDYNTTYFARSISSTELSLHPIENSSALYPQQNAVANESPITITSSGTGSVTMFRVRGQLSPRCFNNGLIIEGSGRAILMKDPSVSTIYYSLYAQFFSNLKVYGIKFWGQQYDYEYNNFKFGDDGLLLSSCHNVEVDGCGFFNQGDASIRFIKHISDYNGASEGASLLRVSNCEFYNFGQCSTTVSNTEYHSTGSDIKYTNNRFERSRLGLKFASRKNDTTDLLVSGNTFKDSPFCHDSGAMLTFANYSRVIAENNFFDGIGSSTSPCYTMQPYNNDAGAATSANNSQYIIKGNIIQNCQKGIWLYNPTFANDGGPGLVVTRKDIMVKDNIFQNLAFTGSIGAVNVTGNPWQRLSIEGNHFADLANEIGVRINMPGEVTSIDHAISINMNKFHGMTHASSKCISITRSNGSNSINGIDIIGNRATSGNAFLATSGCNDVMVDSNTYRKTGGSFISGSPTNLTQGTNAVAV